VNPAAPLTGRLPNAAIPTAYEAYFGVTPMKTCLVVDDSKVIRKVARHILETLNFDVSEAGDGQEALDHCRLGTPDVVLLDWNMPVMSGMEFLRALGLENFTRRPKVIFCTTENGIAHIRAAIDAGADEYVMKPFDRETLQSKFQLVGVA
jgi:two-component system chemotaxis response regulator CheY